jgi:tRNA threonylcarbamoyl adenosine modification protein (Sua5/YciO/YrdC/YwlC family)
MSRRYDLESLSVNPTGFAEAVAEIVGGLKRGEIAAIPDESAYILLCDAFNALAVRRMHSLRGAAEGIAAAVLIAKSETLPGITQNLGDDQKRLAEAFWPGKLTLLVQPHSALHWDLGDGGSLGECAVRVPAADFLRLIVAQVGPTATASASLVGEVPALSLAEIAESISGSIEILVDGGALAAGPATTVVRRSVIGKPSPLEISRVGAISQESLVKVLPDIELASQ